MTTEKTMRKTLLLAAAFVLLGASAAFPQTATVPADGFHSYKDVDPMTDADRSGTFVLDTSDHAKVLNGTAALLAWSCRDDGLNVMFSGNRAGRIETVAVRFPPAPAEAPRRWDRAGTFALLPMDSVQQFTMAALHSPKVVLRSTDGDTATTGVFELTGLAAALKKLPCATQFSTTR
jgi:hypothetical protein